MKRIIGKIIGRLGYTIKRIEKPKKIQTINNHLINHSLMVDIFQYANMQSKHIKSFEEKIRGGGSTY